MGHNLSTDNQPQQLQEEQAIDPDVTDAAACAGERAGIELVEQVEKLDNLPQAAVVTLWNTFMETASSFALDKTEFSFILGKALRRTLFGEGTESERLMDEFARSTFDFWVAQSRVKDSVFVDAMEIITAVLFLSKMTLDDKVNFLFDCMDFTSENDLDIDEVQISVKSIEAGLAKLRRGVKPSDETQIRDLAKMWFQQCLSMPGGTQPDLINRKQFVAFAKQGAIAEVFRLYGEAEAASHDADIDEDPAGAEVRARILRRSGGGGGAGAGGAGADDDDGGAFAEEGGGDENMAIVPWKGRLKYLARAEPHRPDAPTKHVNLAWIHGYRSADCRNNLSLVREGEQHSGNCGNGAVNVAFFAAAVNIVMRASNLHCLPPIRRTAERKAAERKAAEGLESKGDEEQRLDDMYLNKQQAFHNEHDDDIHCQAVAQMRIDNVWTWRAASGEIGKKPTIHVWHPSESDPGEIESTRCFKGFHRNGVAFVCFTPNGRFLASVGMDDEHSIAVYDLEQDKLVCSCKGNRAKVLHAALEPTDSTDKFRLVTCGLKHADIWTISGRGGDKPVYTLNRKKALFKDAGSATLLTAVVRPTNNLTFFGTMKGNILIFQNRDYACMVPHGPDRHEGPVNAMHCPAYFSKNGSVRRMHVSNRLVTGGKDGKVIVWNIDDSRVSASETLVAYKKIDLSGLATPDKQVRSTFVRSPDTGAQVTIPGAVAGEDPYAHAVACETKLYNHAVRSVFLVEEEDEEGNPTGAGTIAVGTQGSEILQLNLLADDQDRNLAVGPVLTRGHCKDELWGLAVHPLRQEYCTVGDDHTLRIFDAATHEQIYMHDMENMARAVAYSPDGSMIAVGFGGRVGRGRQKMDGMFRVYNWQRARDGSRDTAVPVSTLDLVHEARDSKQWISDVKFSPQGKMLAVGSHDNSVYIYSVFQNFTQRRKFSKHSSYITHFDFSRDGAFMRSNCGAYDLLHCDPSTGAQQRDKAMTNVEWATSTCVLGWDVQGIWPSGVDGTDINACDRTANRELLATADDFGKVHIFRYPCADERAQSIELRGHSSHVTNVRWFHDAGPSSSADGTVLRDVPVGLVSTGGNDKAVFQWKLDTDSTRGGGGGSGGGQAATADSVANVEDEDDDDVGHVEGALAGGDEFMAVKPWIGAIVEPTRLSTELEKQERQNLQNSTATLANTHNHMFFPQRPMHPAKRLEIRRERVRRGGARADGGGHLEHKRGDDDEDDDLIEQAELSKSQLIVECRAVRGLIDRVCRGEDKTAPDGDEFELDWVHGYRAFDARDNLMYLPVPSSSSGTQIVYHAAAAGIRMDYPCEPAGPALSRQSFFRSHTDDILCLAMGRCGEEVVVATGQMGHDPCIHVWNPERMEHQCELKGFHKRAVTLVAFSPSGRYIASIGQDDDHSIAIYDWKAGRMCASSKGTRSKTLGLCFGLTDDDVYTSGENFVSHWKRKGKNLHATDLKPDRSGAGGGRGGGKRGGGGGRGRGKPVYMCVHTTSTGLTLVGALDGSISKIANDKIAPMENCAAGAAHSGSVNCIRGSAIPAPSVDEDTPCLVASGDKTGKVVLWQASREGLTEIASFSGFQKNPAVSWEGDDRYATANRDDEYRNTVTVFHAAVRSVCVQGTDASNCTVLVGTQGAEIVELCCTNGAHLRVNRPPLMRGHCKDELWGLAVHPLRQEYCTVGDDHTLRIFDAVTHELVYMHDIGIMARAVAYSPDGSMIAVGFGGRVGRGRQKMDGLFRIYTWQRAGYEGGQSVLLQVHEARDSKQWISDVKFAPAKSGSGQDGQDGGAGGGGGSGGAGGSGSSGGGGDAKDVLAIGSHDNSVYLYDVRQGSNPRQLNVRKRKPFSKHNSYITHIDFSEDGAFMQSNCGAYELLYADAATGGHITSATEMCDVRWATWSCTLGWPVQGIWPPCADGTDVNAVSRSDSGHLLATSDDFGTVKVFRYPCVDKKSQAVELAGHSSHVTNIRWTRGDGYLISAGGNDKCVMQWRHKMVDSGAGEQGDSSGGGGGGGGGMGFGSGGLDGGSSHEGGHDAASLPRRAASDNGDEEDIDEGGGDEFAAVKPWLGMIRAPSQPPENNPRAPSIKVAREWVFGYCCENVRANVWYTSDLNIVYHSAALGICLHRDTDMDDDRGFGTDLPRHFGQQTYFDEHDDDIVCLAISPDRRFVATGQLVGRQRRTAMICVWDPQTGTRLCKLEKAHQRAVRAMAFNPAGDKLVSIGADNNHSHCLWKDEGGSWSRVRKEGESKGDVNPVLFAEWVGDEEESIFVTGGVKHMRLWSTSGAVLAGKKAQFGRQFKQQTLLCAATLEDQVVTGTAKGDLYVWARGDGSGGKGRGGGSGLTCVKMAAAHNGKPVNCLRALGDSSAGHVVSGGKDGSVRIWNRNMECEGTFNIGDMGVLNAGVCALDVVDGNARLWEEAEATVSASEDSGSSSRTRRRAAWRPAPKVGGGAGGSGGGGGGGGGHDGGAGGEDGGIRVTRILVGTQGGEILELNSPGTAVQGSGGEHSDEARFLVQSHSADEVWGVAQHPLVPDIFATCGDDKTVRVWSAGQRRMLACCQVPEMARAITWICHPEIKYMHFLAVGMGGDIGRGRMNKKKNSPELMWHGTFCLLRWTGPGVEMDSEAQELLGGGGGGGAAGAGAAGGSGGDAGSVGSDILTLYMHSIPRYPAKAWISDIKVGHVQRGHDLKEPIVLALGAHDQEMYFFRIIARGMEEASSIRDDTILPLDLVPLGHSGVKHSSAITHFDFAEGPRIADPQLPADTELWIQSNSLAYELLFWKLKVGEVDVSSTDLQVVRGQVLNGSENPKAYRRRREEFKTPHVEMVTSASAMRDVVWDSWTCTLGWPVQGIWPACADGTDINSVDRSNHSVQGQPLIITGDDDSLIKVFRYPCISKDAKCLELSGHSSHVANVRWTADDARILSVGGNDKAAMVWRVTGSV